VGNNINFLNDRPNKYYFYSLDDDILFYLNYDSIKGKRLIDLQSNYFFFRKSDYELTGENEYQTKGMELFLYTPNPPKFDFRYSLVLIDSSYKVLLVLKEFDNTLPWSAFDLTKNLETANAKLAIKLRIEDSINDQKMTFWKKLR
jgi:hypothetical protein